MDTLGARYAVACGIEEHLRFPTRFLGLKKETIELEHPGGGQFTRPSWDFAACNTVGDKMYAALGLYERLRRRRFAGDWDDAKRVSGDQFLNNCSEGAAGEFSTDVVYPEQRGMSIVASGVFLD
ncbi:hypothetical protein [Nitratireductor pacificus]|uniref:Uncharacterized protein n=1 Tax=Nitratireductor pacificus pht-3B TaxID=391937 RepID=K2MJW5_9HYPH|nr:hypothetical protein [Nitratireductor pacificus]EKF21015.1 hypothetical protein NA2_01515 [Nitratireductor pacificus pht-3B]